MMTVNKESDWIDLETTESRRNLLVGIRFDKESKELLCWTLLKVARSQDRVVALHVCRNSEDASKNKKLLDGYVEVYKPLCDKKKVKLRGKILIGKSVRKTLVTEAKNSAAAAVIVGINTQCPIGCWTSTATYCAKHLPPSTKILTNHHGRIVLQRSTNSFQSGHERAPSLRSKTSKSAIQDECSKAGSTDIIGEDVINNKRGVVEIGKEISSESLSLLSDSFEDQRPGWPGWPLLLRTSLPTQRALDARKLSVVQWAMSLPHRNSSSKSCSSKSDSPRQRLLSCHGGQSESKSSNLTWFSYEVLSNATAQFSSENLIGKGGYSNVFKGTFPDGKQVAVKVLKSSERAWKDFSLEVNIVSYVRHKNITPLLGVCIDNNELISVYGFIPKGSLEENLHGKKRQSFMLPLEARFRVAVGIAEALDYLHNGCPRPIVHRDVKSSNILLSEDFEPQLSDFGLAIWGPNSSCLEICTDVVGTFGYLAPEYLMYGKVTDKVDVYSFGVVLLELISGRKPIESSKGQESLVIWGKPKLEDRNLKELIDPTLKEGGFEEWQVQRMVVAARLCLKRAAALRPNVSQILKLLKGEEVVHAWTKSSSQRQLHHTEGFSDIEVYHSNSSVIESKANTKVDMDMNMDMDVDVKDEVMSSDSVGSNNVPCVEEYLKLRCCSQKN